MNAREIVAWNVRELRSQRGLSQEALADAAGVNRTYISEIERMTVSVSVDLLERLAAYFAVEISDFLRRPLSNAMKPLPLKPGRKRQL